MGLSFRLNEDGIVYWVAVHAGTVYPKPEPGTDEQTAPLTSDYAKLQVASGMNIGAEGKAGRVNLVNVPHSVAQGSGNSVSLHFLNLGSYRTLGQQRIVQLAVLVPCIGLSAPSPRVPLARKS